MNNRRVPMFSIAVIAVAILLGAGGWLVWTLKAQHQQTAQHLRETTTALEEDRKTLTMLETERRMLSQAYDELKARWAKSDGEVQRLTQASEQLSAETVALTRERTSLERQLEEAKTGETRLHHRFKTLEEEHATLRNTYAAAEAKRAALETTLSQTSVTLTSAEVEQLARAFAKQQEDTTRMSQRLAELPATDEQLAAEQAPGDEQRAAESDLLPLLLPMEALDAGLALRPDTFQVTQVARRYRNLGESYLAIRQYPRAAEAFEQSLSLQDEPELHAKLVTIYGRLLHDRQQAQRHAAALGPSMASPIIPLDSMAETHGLPRKGWRLLWEWLLP